MITASIITIGDEILIGQIVDTNSSAISRSLGSIGIRCSSMSSIADDRDAIISESRKALKNNDIVILTGGLGPTKDDITKDALRELFGSRGYVINKEQSAIIHSILQSRGLDRLEANRNQALVPDGCEVIPNRRGTAPIMVFRFDAAKFGHTATLYSLPGVPHEALAALPEVLDDIKSHYTLDSIYHKNIMTYGLAESALSELIEPWEDSLPQQIRLAYLPNTLTGVRLRLSCYGMDQERAEQLLDSKTEELKKILSDKIYATTDSNLQTEIGRLLRGKGLTICAAESCTGGEIAHLITSVSGSSEYFIGSVTSYAIEVKEKLLNVKHKDIVKYGVVSGRVAAQMAVGVRKLLGTTYAVATTGLAEGNDDFEKEGTVWIAVTGPHGTVTKKFEYHNDRIRNIQRFAATALDMLRTYILDDLY